MAVPMQAVPSEVGEPRRISVTSQLGGVEVATQTAGRNSVSRVSIAPACYVQPAIRSAVSLPVDISRPIQTVVQSVRKDTASSEESDISLAKTVTGQFSVHSERRRSSAASIVFGGAPRPSLVLGAHEDPGLAQPATILHQQSATSRRRASSLVSTGTFARRYSIEATPESRYYPGGVTGLSFGAPVYTTVNASPATSANGSPMLAPAPGTMPLDGFHHMLAPPPPPYMPTTATAMPPHAAPPMFAPPCGPGAPPPVDVSSTPLQSNAHLFMPGQALQIPCGAYLQPTMDGGYVVQMPASQVMPGMPGMPPPPAQQLPPQYMMPPPSVFTGASTNVTRTTRTPYVTATPPPAPSPQVVAAPAARVGAPKTNSGAHGPITTIMLRNIPQRYNRDLLLADMDARGFGGAYDFFYLPIDFSTTHSVGYAFINFITEAELARFRSVYSGLKLSEDSPKVCEICEAKVQGKDGNVEYYRNSTVMGMDERYHPVVLDHGVRLPFPKPTRPLGPVQRRPPRAGGRV